MTIRKGSRGDRVRSFQAFLIDLGFLPEGDDDGIAGRRTDTAIRAYQASKGLSADGIVGPNTARVARMDGWSHADSALTHQKAAALELGLPLEVVQAIEAVESGGKPRAMRFEPHVFLRKRPDLADQIPFTAGPRGYSITRSETNVAAFERAFRLDPVAATESTSFGLYQVLGGHLIKLYGSPDVGVETFLSEPIRVSYQLFASWFKASPRALRAAADRDWRELARRYNGPGQVPHYSAALEREYTRIVG